MCIMEDPVNRLVVRIALLSLVDDVPEKPSITRSVQAAASQEGLSHRSLSLKHEVSIAQHLAFVSAYSDSPYHVMAVCIEEEVQRASLVIRFAANTGEHKALLDGLKNISVILQNEAANGTARFPVQTLHNR